MCKDTASYFKDSYIMFNKLLFTIRNDKSFVFDLVSDAVKYITTMKSQCLHFLDTITKFFFTDFGSSRRSAYDLHYILFKLIKVNKDLTIGSAGCEGPFERV